MTFGEEVVEIAKEQIGKPYIWGAKGEDSFDCSGLVTYCMKVAGFTNWEKLFLKSEIANCNITSDNWERFASAQRLWDMLSGVVFQPYKQKSGDLAFYGMTERHIDHVVICVGDGKIIGACGGNSATVKPVPGARVKYKESVNYRPDFRGFRLLPDTTLGVV